MALVLDPIFVKNMDALIDAALASANADDNVALQPWFLGDITLWTGDVLDVDAIDDAFNRDSAGETYSNLLTGGGTVGEAASFTLQSDYLGMLERAFRMRHASPIRSRAHSAVRKSAHGLIEGCIGRVMTYAQDMISSGESPEG